LFDVLLVAELQNINTVKTRSVEAEYEKDSVWTGFVWLRLRSSDGLL
jgi:hypothetical protein